MTRPQKPDLRTRWAAFNAVEPLGRRLMRWFDYLVLTLAMVWCWDALTSRAEHARLRAAIDANAQRTTVLTRTTAALTTRVSTVEGRLGIAESTTAPLWPGADTSAVSASRFLVVPPLVADEPPPDR